MWDSKNSKSKTYCNLIYTKLRGEVKVKEVAAAYIQLNVTRNQGEYKYDGTDLNNSAAAGNSAMLAAGYAFTPRLSLYAAYLNFTATGSAYDSHTTLLAGNYRF